MDTLSTDTLAVRCVRSSTPSEGTEHFPQGAAEGAVPERSCAGGRCPGLPAAGGQQVTDVFR